MKITRDWLMQHRTVRGAWTRNQLEAIGLRWPPHRGWIGLVSGQTITPEQQQRFEADAGTQGSLLDHVLE
jgi:hypothetical protein